MNADWYFDLHWLDRANYLKAEGYEVHVALPECRSHLIRKFESLKFTIHLFSMNRSKLNPIKEIFALLSLFKIINKIMPSIVHSVTIKPNLYSAVICKKLSIPLVSTYAGLGTLSTSDRLHYKILRLLIFSVIKHSTTTHKNHALFENDVDRNFLIKNKTYSMENSSRVFGAGIDIDKFKFIPQDYDSLHNPKFSIFFASRLLKDKGLDTLVSAVKELKSAGMNMELKVAGIIDDASPLAIPYDKIEEYKHDDDIEWLGERNDICKLIEGCHAVILPTRYGEGVPRILIESAAIGRPMITTDLGGCSDICIHGDTGFIVRPGNVEDLKHEIIRLNNDRELLANLGRNGRKLMERLFSNETVFSKHLDTYNKVMKQR